MLQHVIRKVLMVIPLLILISIILFILISMLPGDAVLSMIGDTGDIAYIEQLRSQIGLDKPLYQQYFDWIRNLFKGDLGRSILTRQPVVNIVKVRFPVTLELTILAILISMVIAIPAGILSAVKRNSVWDVIMSVVSMFGIAMPPFWIGILAIMFFSLKLNWLPASGFVPFFQDPIANLRSLAMPAFTVGLAFAATVMRQTRSAFLEILNQDFIMTARSKGLREKIVLWKHALRNALIPIITVISLQIGRLIGGSVVTETVFALPGMGREIADGLLSRDYPVVMAMILITAVFVVVTNTIVDVLVVLVDPRISRTSAKG
ncbi:MAG: ABC transporter permease [Spirochaetia bacterium]|jgi:peptide/nickel transport system permease protein|nr:ABC transporter permease [Spirochaetia bacterium]